MILYGDSVLHGGVFPGLHRVPEPPAVALKRMRSAYQVIDRSANGTSAIRSTHAILNDRARARIMVLSYGINDAGIADAQAYESAMRTLLEYARASRQAALLTGLSRVNPPNPEVAMRNTIAKRLASEYGVAFADWHSVQSDVDDMADAVHPAQPYSHRLVQQLAETMDRMAPECARP